MKRILQAFGEGKLINLHPDLPIGSRSLHEPGDVKTAAFKVGLFVLMNEALEDSPASRRIDEMEVEEERLNNFELHRRELVVMPLTRALQAINEHYAKKPLSSPEVLSQWNAMIEDFLIMAFGSFCDYLLGIKMTKKGWVEIAPPRPEEVAMVATDLASMLGTLGCTPFLQFTSDANKKIISELFTHLQPHMTCGGNGMDYRIT